MESFVHAMPRTGFAGGLMIGLAAAFILLGAGRIAGVSGMAARAAGLSASGAPRRVAVAFILGLPLGAIVMAALDGPVLTRFPGSPLILIMGGLFVGFGTRLGSGCTSGHGGRRRGRVPSHKRVRNLSWLHAARHLHPATQLATAVSGLETARCHGPGTAPSSYSAFCREIGRILPSLMEASVGFIIAVPRAYRPLEGRRFSPWRDGQAW